jgi:hypothetical protein
VVGVGWWEEGGGSGVVGGGWEWRWEEGKRLGERSRREKIGEAVKYNSRRPSIIYLHPPAGHKRFPLDLLNSAP